MKVPARVVLAATADDIEAVALLIREYAEWLGIDLSFQNFDQELASLPGGYAPPDGRLFLAVCGNEAAGCVGLRRFDEYACEMKRMWVRPAFRSQGLGRLLAENVIREARTIGYKEMLLDSLPSLESAIALYRSFGFEQIPAYRYNPEPGAVFMRLDLREMHR